MAKASTNPNQARRENDTA